MSVYERFRYSPVYSASLYGKEVSLYYRGTGYDVSACIEISLNRKHYDEGVMVTWFKYARAEVWEGAEHDNSHYVNVWYTVSGSDTVLHDYIFIHKTRATNDYEYFELQEQYINLHKYWEEVK